MLVFRGKLLDKLEKLIYNGKLVIPKQDNADEINILLSILRQKNWNNYVGKRYYHGNGVLKYLAATIAQLHKSCN